MTSVRLFHVTQRDRDPAWDLVNRLTVGKGEPAGQRSSATGAVNRGHGASAARPDEGLRAAAQGAPAARRFS